jgi:hypothetical protein
MEIFKQFIVTCFTIVVLYSCSFDPKGDYIDDFGTFVNETELSQETYSVEDWEYIEVEFNNFSVIEYMDYENELTELEKKQISSYNYRFKKMRVKKDPAGSILDILGF